MPIFDRDHADSPEKAYVYILRCADGTLYCGWTNDLAARLDAHNSGKGAKYTRGRGPVELAYSEMFDTQSEAMHREAEIKKLTRPQKQALLDSQTGGEMLTVYDAADRPCGARPRRIVHAQGLRHHVCHLWVVGMRDGVRGIWLQKRQNDRPLYPGFYDLTATGHMDPGETPLTAALVELKLEEFDLLYNTQIFTKKTGSVFRLGCFTVEFIHVNHSIPDAVALAIGTPLGTVIHTGDFKIDVTPISGGMFDIARFGQLGNDGVLALLAVI